MMEVTEWAHTRSGHIFLPQGIAPSYTYVLRLSENFIHVIGHPPVIGRNLGPLLFEAGELKTIPLTALHNNDNIYNALIL